MCIHIDRVSIPVCTSASPALLMQTNPNWLAFFIITDPSPFERRLQEILQGFNDPRLQYVDVDLSHRPVVSNMQSSIINDTMC